MTKDKNSYSNATLFSCNILNKCKPYHKITIVMLIIAVLWNYLVPFAQNSCTCTHQSEWFYHQTSSLPWECCQFKFINWPIKCLFLDWIQPEYYLLPLLLQKTVSYTAQGCILMLVFKQKSPLKSICIKISGITWLSVWELRALEL